MTRFSKTKAAGILSLDQSLLYALVALERANRAYDNYEWDRNPTLPPEAQDDINFAITKDPSGIGRISFKAVIGLHNRHPFKTKTNILDSVVSFTSYYSNEIDTLNPPDPTLGLQRPPIPTNIVCLEQYLVWLALLANAYREYVIIYNSDLTTTPDSINNVLPRIIAGDFNGINLTPWDNHAAIDTLSTNGDGLAATGWEFLYDGNVDQLAPDWYKNKEQNYDGSRAIGSVGDNPQSNSVGDNPVQTLAVCKDQDPNATDYGTINGISLWEIIKGGKN
jgi:hypothetical protein